jgi:hypothetical protein
MDFIAVAADGRAFVGAGSGAPWTPWGFNYDHDDETPSRLLEDYWSSEWTRVERDFASMRALGATVVRVPLQLPRFLRGPLEVDEGALDRLRQLVALAERLGLRLDLTGLANFRPVDVPRWYSELPEAERWSAQGRFWEAVASAVTTSPAVFCFNLMNEPVVPEEDHATWAPPPWIDGSSYVEYVARAPAARPRADIARKWLRMLTAAIRRRDRRHLITVGVFAAFGRAEVLPLGLTPSQLASEVDFLSLHLYPKRGGLAEAKGLLRQMSVGKPLVVEESGPLECSVAELGVLMTESRGHVAGWLGFYWGGEPEELRRSNSVAKNLIAEWLDLMHRMSPDRR